MEWVLVITILLENKQQLVEVRPFGEWICSVVSSSIKEKKVYLDNKQLAITKVECIEK